MRNVIELVLTGNSSRLLNALNGGERGLRRFGSQARQEFDRIRNAARSLEGTLVSLGVGYGMGRMILESARLDKSLVQIGQTAGGTALEVKGLRADLFGLGRESGQSVESLKDGFNVLVQSGQNMSEARATLQGINTAMAVTGSNAETLASGLTVAEQAFQFDLSKPGLALDLLDKMTVAGRLGNAELEDLSGVFARLGVNAASAGMKFDTTLAFVEGLSLIERQPERLATLADSTLRVFTNMRYMAEAQKATKAFGKEVKFFDKGQRRDAFAVLDDIREQYKTLTTDKQRADFIQQAFGKTDQDTIKGLRTLLAGDSLDKVRQFSREIGGAGGTLKRDFNEATRNLFDQTGRLKNALSDAAEAFTIPLNKGITAAIKKLLDKKEEGGWDLSGSQIAGGGAAALGAGYLAYRFGGKALKGVLGKLGGTAAGIAEGKAIEAATGVTPVFVTNWPGNLSGGGAVQTAAALAGKGGWLAKIAKSVPMLIGGKLALAGAAGFAIGEGINMMAGDQKGWLGDMVYDWLHPEEKTEVKNTINITVDKDGRVIANSDNMNTTVNAKRGKF